MWFEKTAFNMNKAAQYFWENSQTEPVKAEDRLSLDGVGQHLLSNVYLMAQPVSSL